MVQLRLHQRALNEASLRPRRGHYARRERRPPRPIPSTSRWSDPALATPGPGGTAITVGARRESHVAVARAVVERHLEPYSEVVGPTSGNRETLAGISFSVDDQCRTRPRTAVGISTVPTHHVRAPIGIPGRQGRRVEPRIEHVVRGAGPPAHTLVSSWVASRRAAARAILVVGALHTASGVAIGCPARTLAIHDSILRILCVATVSRRACRGQFAGGWRVTKYWCPSTHSGLAGIGPSTGIPVVTGPAGQGRIRAYACARIACAGATAGRGSRTGSGHARTRRTCGAPRACAPGVLPGPGRITGLGLEGAGGAASFVDARLAGACAGTVAADVRACSSGLPSTR